LAEEFWCSYWQVWFTWKQQMVNANNSDLGIRTSGLCRSCWKVMMNLCDVPPVPFLSPRLKIKMLQSSNSKKTENTCISVPLLLVHNLEKHLFSFY